jgi:hypothetical protein
MSEMIFRLIATTIFVIGITISFYYRFKAQRVGGGVSRKEEGTPILVLLRVGGLAMWLGLLAYLINPQWMRWASLLPFTYSNVCRSTRFSQNRP